jgi:tRNA A-37 threonylcarbamoyl transferase component Bud32
MSEHSTLPSPIGRYAHESPEPTCLNENEVLAFVQGLWEGEQLEKLHAHLDGCDACQKMVTEAAHALSSTPDIEIDQDSTIFQKTDVVAQRYLVLRFIAKGGMGEVYEVYDRELKERVALKTLTSSFSQSARAIRRLKAEAQLARRVSHPNVCRIYDLGTHVIGGTGAIIHFLTMELVHGESLGQRVRSGGAIPVEEANQLAHQLLLGLSAAHRAGILHRDFKSDNVMLRPETSGELTAVIMDFGLARALGRDTAQLTTGRNQGLVGTIAYMSPEQIESRPLTTASDVYSFGIAWFEMLTGKLPFIASTGAGTALERFNRAAVSPSSVNPAVPRSLDPIVLKCLSRRSEDRFTTPDEVLAALSHFARLILRGGDERSRLWPMVSVGALAVAVYAFFALAMARSHPHDGKAGQFAVENPIASVAAEAQLIINREERNESNTEPSAAESAETLPARSAPTAVTLPRIRVTKPTPSAAAAPEVVQAKTAEKIAPSAHAPDPSEPPHASDAPKPSPGIEPNPATNATPSRRQTPPWEDPFQTRPSDPKQDPNLR